SPTSPLSLHDALPILPLLGDPAARTALAPLRHRRAPPGRPAPAGPPRTLRLPTAGRGRPGPLGPPAPTQKTRRSGTGRVASGWRSEEHTSELQSLAYL